MEKDNFNEELTILLNNQINSIEILKNNIDNELFDAFNLILENKGKLVFSGVGKSGHIGRKCAASYSSTGTSSIYLEPLDAAHGDLGMIEGCSVAILISHSGNTKEMMDIIPVIKKLNLKIICITSNSNSSMAKIADVHINTMVEKENCPHNLAPTISTTTSMTILDTLMVLLMKEKKFQKEHFALYHPAGSLEKKLLFKVENIMKKQESGLNKSDSVVTVISEMTKIGKGIVPIIEDNNLIGVITDGDLRRAMENYKEEIFNISIEDFMTTNFKSIEKDIFAVEALRILKDNQITVIPVIENEKIIGIIHIHDILNEGIK